MSIDYGNNLNSLTGLKLPIPYVDRALVTDDTIEVKLAFYVTLDPEQKIEEMTEILSDVKFYIGQVFDGPPAGPDEASAGAGLGLAEWPGEQYSDLQVSNGATNRFVDLLSDNNIMNYLVNNFYHRNLDEDGDTTQQPYDVFVSPNDDSSTSGTLSWYLLKQHKSLWTLSFDDFEMVSDITDIPPGNRRMVKYVADAFLGSDWSGANQRIDTTNAGTDNPQSSTNVYSVGPSVNIDMHLVAFSSILDLSQYGRDWVTLSIGDPVYDSAMDIRFRKLNNSMFSQFSHNSVFKGGMLDRTPTKLFVYENGARYNGNAIQTIDGSYRTERMITRQAMLSSFLNLNSSPASGVYGPLEEVLDAFNYILSIF